jgi:hypothetical protein
LKSWFSLSLSNNSLLSLWNRRFITVLTKARHWTLSCACQRISSGPRRFETYRNILHFNGEGLTHAQLTSWRTTPYRMSATTCSIYSQLSSISGGRLLDPKPEDAPCRGDKGPA